MQFRPLTTLITFLLLASNVLATTPPELTALQQQYENAVLAPHAAAKADLDAKFITALGNAVTTAKQAGKLDDVLAIQDDQKRLTDKLPLPDDDDKTPEALKKLRSIYRDQLAKLEAQRTAKHTALLPAYAGKLKDLEATLTKADRIDEAKEVRAYREGLATGVAPSVAAVEKPATPTAAPTESKKEVIAKGKGDDRKAAEWVRSLGDKHKLVTDEGKVIKTTADIPKHKFAIAVIQIDGRSLDAPVTAELLKVLAGLDKLGELKITHVKLPDEAFDFLSTLPELGYLVLENTGSTDSVVSKVAGCKALKRLEFNLLDGFKGSALGQLAGLKRLAELRCWKTSLNDDGVAQISNLSHLSQLLVNGHRAVTDASIPHLQKLKELISLYIDGTAMTAKAVAAGKWPNIVNLSFNKLDEQPFRETAAILAPAFPKVFRIEVNYDVLTAEDTAALAKFPKFTHLHSYGDISPEAMSGLAACPGLIEFDSPSSQVFTDQHLRGLAGSHSIERILMANSEVTDAGLMALVPMKKLKLVSIKAPALTDAGIAAFKKARKDVKVEK